jgi:Zn-dependent peptidase ImmA (M78 family)
LLKKFLKFACKHLEIEGAPIDLYLTAERGGPIKTTASFNTENHEIWIYVKNRAIYDILRSIAHEIRHYKQSLDNVLTPDSGKTGSKHEDEANIFAGNCLRIFSNLEPSIYD